MARKYQHLSETQRCDILVGLKQRLSLRQIASRLDRSPSTISREVFIHRMVTKAYYANDGRCRHYLSCGQRRHGCMSPTACDRYETEGCPILSGWPWVCDGCAKIVHCRRSKQHYAPSAAHEEYQKTLSGCRTGARLSADRLAALDATLASYAKGQRQSLAMIAAHQPLPVSRSTIYRYLDAGRLPSVSNLDLPRRIRFSRHRRKAKVAPDDSRLIYQGRTYQDFIAFTKAHPRASVVEMDSVMGPVGASVLLTLYIRKPKFLLAFKRSHDDARSVIDIWRALQHRLGVVMFLSLFSIALPDRGGEFAHPQDLERMDASQCRHVHLFYCDPMSPFEKGGIENAHEFIRRFVPKGRSFDALSQHDIDMMIDQINSVPRLSLDGRCPFEALSKPQLKAIKKLGYHRVPTDSVTLSSDLFNK